MQANRWPRRAAILALAIGLVVAGCKSDDPRSLLADARQQRDRGQLRAAVIQLKNALQQDDKLRDARTLLGEVYLEQGDAASAEKELRRALALGERGDAGQLAILIGRAMLMQGQFARLLQQDAPSPADPLYPEAIALRGDALLGLGKTSDAEAQYMRALAQRPNAPDALLGLARIASASDAPREADALIARALAAAPGHIACLRFRGDQQRAEGQPLAALTSYRQILALRPDNAQAYTDIAAVDGDTGHFSEAHAALAAARKAAGTTLPIVYAEAMLAFREHQLQEALGSVQQILRAAPEHYPSLLLAATVEAAMGSDEQAQQHLQRFLSAHPGHLFATKGLASLHLRAGRNEAATRLLAPLLAAHPDDVELLTLSGQASLQAHQYTQASDLFEKASALRPREALLHTQVALSRLAGGDNGRALAQLEQAASLDLGSQRNDILLVMTQLRAHDTEKALAVALEMEQRGDNPLIENLKGGVYLAKHDTASARASFDKALALDPLYLPALANLAQLDKAENHIDMAVRRYQAALARAPGRAELMESLAGLALARGNNADAVAWLERAVKAHPDSLPLALHLVETYLRAGANAKALVLTQQLQASHPDNIEALSMLAQLYWINQNYPAAASAYASLAALTPSAPLPHLRLAMLSLATHDEAAAQASLRKSLALAPDLFDAQLALVNLLTSQHKFLDALTLARAAQQHQPKSPNGYKLEADVYAAQEQYSLAAIGYQRAFALAPSGALLIQLHGTLLHLGKGAEAEQRIASWLSQHPTDVATRLHYASSKLIANDLRGAIEQFEALLKADPDNVPALNDLAWAYQRSGGKRSLEYAERAYRLAPHNPSVIDTLGWICMESGNLARALPLLQQASAIAPDAGEIHYHLAMVLARTGDKRGARRELERLLVAPGNAARRDQARALLATL